MSDTEERDGTTDGIRSDGEASSPISNLITCSGCGSIGYSDEAFCVCCGRPRQGAPRRCGNCRAEIKHRRANYCPSCGTRTPQANEPLDLRK